MKLLIDCDYIVYKCCASTETELDFGEDVIVVTSNFKEAYNCVKRDLQKIQDEFGSFSEIVLFFTSPKILGKKFCPNIKGIDNEKSPVALKESSIN